MTSPANSSLGSTRIYEDADRVNTRLDSFLLCGTGVDQRLYSRIRDAAATGTIGFDLPSGRSPVKLVLVDDDNEERHRKLKPSDIS